MLILAVAILGALVPTIFYVLFVWSLDQFEKEPLWLLALAFLWGAIPAAVLSVIFELLFEIPLVALGGEGLVADLISASISAPLVEESFKGIALLGLVLTFRQEFDDVLDGIIYGAMVGFGFALTENSVAYFLPILLEEGIAAGLLNIFLRAVVFGVNHAFWTGIIGAAVGYARLVRQQSQRVLVPVAAWFLAVSLHGIHNAGASLVEQTLCFSLLFRALVDWVGFLLLLGLARLTLRHESSWIKRGLIEEVRQGVLTAEEFYLLASARERLKTLWRARLAGGRAGHRAVRRYFQCASELSFRKQRLRSLGDEGGTLDEIQSLRSQLAAYRAKAQPWLKAEQA